MRGGVPVRSLSGIFRFLSDDDAPRKMPDTEPWNPEWCMPDESEEGDGQDADDEKKTHLETTPESTG